MLNSRYNQNRHIPPLFQEAEYVYLVSKQVIILAQRTDKTLRHTSD